jgi:hypothetical protein
MNPAFFCSIHQHLKGDLCEYPSLYLFSRSVMPHVNESERMYIEMGKNKDEREREAKGHFS